MNGARIPSQGRPSVLAGALTCTRCGSSIALDRSVLDLARTELFRALGWEPDRAVLQLSGCCSDCQAGRPDRAGWGHA